MIVWDRPSTLFEKQSEDVARYIDQAVQSLAPERKEKVVAACREAKLPVGAEKALLWQTVCLMGVESDDRHRVMTPAELDKALVEVQNCADMLLDALGALGLNSYLVHSFGRMVANELPELERLILGETPPTPSTLQIEILKIAVQRLRQTRPVMGGGGRRKVLPLYADIVAAIWENIRDCGLSAGRGGEFERLCDAVFEAAGVPAKAEGAIRYFTKNLLHKKKHKVIELFNEPLLPGKVPD